MISLAVLDVLEQALRHIRRRWLCGTGVRAMTHLRCPWTWTWRADELADAADRLCAMLDVSHALALIDDEPALLARIASSACRCLGYGVAVVMVRDAGGLYRCRASAGASPALASQVQALAIPAAALDALHIAATPLGSVLYVPHDHPVWRQPGIAEHFIETAPSVPATEWHPASFLFMPLTDAQGENLGFLNLDDPLHGGLPTRGQTAVFAVFAHQAAVALQVVRGRAADRQRRRQVEGLLQASASVRGSLDLDNVLQQIATAMTSAGGFGRVAVYLRDATDDLLHVRAAVGLSAADDAHMRAEPVPLRSFAHLMQPEMRLSRSYLYDHRYHTAPHDALDYLSIPDNPPDWQEGQWRAEDSLTIPLEDREGRCIGLISVDEPHDKEFPDLARIQALELFADHCTIAVEHARLYEEVRHLALIDTLTGLHNRRAFHDALSREMARVQREGVSCALLFCDIDHFKRVNDTYGHATGDQILQAVAVLLRQRLRQGDLAARYGGEEFVALLPNTTRVQAVAVAEDLRQQVAALAAPLAPEGLVVSISIGVASATGATDSAETLIAAADQYLYAAKEGGRNRVCAA